jgi:hypothetical protein
MSVQSVFIQDKIKIEWDDGSVIIFSFTGGDGKTYTCGFPHVVSAGQSQVGTQTQVSKTVQTIQQNALQISLDPATWVETVKQGARSGGVLIVYDDSTSVPYSTPLTNYDLYNLYSITG